MSQTRNQVEANGKQVTTCFTLVSCLDYYSKMKMDATYSSETSVDFQTAWCYSPEDKTILKIICFVNPSGKSNRIQELDK
jgi:hypothetical protein